MNPLIELTELYIVCICVLVFFIPPVFDKVLYEC